MNGGRERERERESAQSTMCCGLQQLQSLLNSRLLLSLVITASLYGQPRQLHLIIRPVAADDQQQQVDCLNQRCGEIQVTYPFKLANATDCTSFSSDFVLKCDPETGHVLFNNTPLDIIQSLRVLALDNIQRLRVLALTNDSIALDVTSITVNLTMENETCVWDEQYIYLSPFPSPYVFSDDNNLGVFGCASGTVILTNTTWKPNSTTGGSCDTLCPWGGSSSPCGKRPCCIFPWPNDYFPRWAYYMVMPTVVFNNTYVSDNCSLNSGALFHYNHSDFGKDTYGIKLKWALPSNQTSKKAIQHSTEYACSSNAVLTMFDGVPGYLCSCPSGYDGSGYAHGSSCTDINECEGDHDCVRGQSKCHNTEGSYECKCNSIFKVGDGKQRGSGCSLPLKKVFGIIISILILSLVMLALALFSMIRFEWKKRKRRKYFKKNAGDQVQHLLLSGENWNEGRRLYKPEELETATDNFSNDMRLGVGGSGTVFKGLLKDGTMIAIKKANKKGNATQFVNELRIMLQINHRNIVKFLGCCVETIEPLLVYEFALNGTVMENLRQGNRSAMDWKQRLEVARQTAEALAYLHEAASPTILHRDVKSSNVLLDNNFNAKVADFGASCLVPEGERHVEAESHALAAVQGTMGYLDPEYLQTLEPTKKSDVYSFGVMLVELMTGLKPVDTHREDVNLALLFVHKMDADKLEDVIDCRLHVHVDHIHSSIFDVASLALRCLSLHGSQRPSMSHVVEQLALNITRYFGHANEANLDADEVGHSSYGAVVQHGFNFSIQEFGESRLTSGDNMEMALLDCTMPR